MTKKILITAVRDYTIDNDVYSHYLASQALNIIAKIALEYNINIGIDVVKYDVEWIKLSLKGTKEEIYKIKTAFVLQCGTKFIWKDVWL